MSKQSPTSIQCKSCHTTPNRGKHASFVRTMQNEKICILLQGEGIIAVCDGLRTPRLSYLDVSENSLGAEGITALAAAIPRLANTHLHHLDLSGVWYPSDSLYRRTTDLWSTLTIVSVPRLAPKQTYISTRSNDSVQLLLYVVVPYSVHLGPRLLFSLWTQVHVVLWQPEYVCLAGCRFIM